MRKWMLVICMLIFSVKWVWSQDMLSENSAMPRVTVFHQPPSYEEMPHYIPDTAKAKLLLAGNGDLRQHKICGKVVKSSGKPLERAWVVVEDIETLTDTAGMFCFGSQHHAVQKLTIDYINYKKKLLYLKPDTFYTIMLEGPIDEDLELMLTELEYNLTSQVKIFEDAPERKAKFPIANKLDKVPERNSFKDSLKKETAVSQDSIRGTIIDNNGNPAIAADVSFPTTGFTTQTDFDGNYSIPVTRNKSAYLEIDVYGYKTKRVPIKNKRKINISIKAIAPIVCGIIIVTKTDTISGKVMDDNATPMQHVIVNTAGNKSSIQTDVAGNFKLKVNRYEGAALIFDEGGYDKKQVIIRNKQKINIHLIATSSKCGPTIIWKGRQYKPGDRTYGRLLRRLNRRLNRKELLKQEDEE